MVWQEEDQCKEQGFFRIGRPHFLCKFWVKRDRERERRVFENKKRVYFKFGEGEINLERESVNLEEILKKRVWRERERDNRFSREIKKNKEVLKII